MEVYGGVRAVLVRAGYMDTCHRARGPFFCSITRRWTGEVPQKLSNGKKALQYSLENNLETYFFHV